MTERRNPPPAPFPHLSADDELALVANALGHPVRIQILRLVMERQECVGAEIVEDFPLAPSTVSDHLRVLREAGLIYAETKGTQVCYCADPMRLSHFHILLESLIIGGRS